MIMPWPQSACMSLHGSCVKLPCVPLLSMQLIAQHALSVAKHDSIKSKACSPSLDSLEGIRLMLILSYEFHTLVLLFLSGRTDAGHIRRFTAKT